MGQIIEQTNSEDFIFIEPDDVRDDVGDDDESYDYCDDVYSLHSSGDLDSVCSEDGENNSTKEIIDMSVSVPSVLMKDLDDAHAAAALARIPDLERCDNSVSTLDHEKDQEPLADTGNKKTSKTVSPPQTTVADESNGSVSMSRTSNKKRRKKLKLMKKAQAAASAAQTLAERTLAASKSKKLTRNKSRSCSGRPATKKVANYAVACATETLAAYREEVIRKQHCL